MLGTSLRLEVDGAHGSATDDEYDRGGFRVCRRRGRRARGWIFYTKVTVIGRWGQLAGSTAEKVYAGVLGKIIGVYLGRPVEGWPYKGFRANSVKSATSSITALKEPLIVADDDISGTFAFFRAVSDNDVIPPTAQQVGHTWLNYIIERRTILWWGGVGRSTEHTAYFRLNSGN